MDDLKLFSEAHFKNLSPRSASEFANAAVRQWIESQPIVRSYGGQCEWYSEGAVRWLESTVGELAVQARLVAIEPIKRDTAESLLRELKVELSAPYLFGALHPRLESLLGRARKLLGDT